MSEIYGNSQGNKVFSLGVTWQVWDKVDIAANSLEEAIGFVKQNQDLLPLGREPEYIDGSYDIDSDVELSVRKINKMDNIISLANQQKLHSTESPQIKNYVPFGTNFKLDHLVISDDNDDVYKAIEQGYGLDKILSYDYSPFNVAMAENGYMLDQLIDSNDSEVRLVVAEQGYGLDKLVNDPDSVISEVAFNGIAYCFPNSEVILRNGLEGFDKYVEAWKELYPERCVDRGCAPKQTNNKDNIKQTIVPDKSNNALNNDRGDR